MMLYLFSESKPRFNWYFVTIIVLTYCENNLLYCDFEFLQGTEVKKSELRNSLGSFNNYVDKMRGGGGSQQMA